jgi:hypothetical protein
MVRLAKKLIYKVLTKFLFGVFGVFPNKQSSFVVKN